MTKSMGEIAEFLYDRGYFGTTRHTQEFFMLLMKYCEELHDKITKLEEKKNDKNS